MPRLVKVAIICLLVSIPLAAQKPPAAYSAEEVSEFSQTLSDGTKIHTETHSKTYQDSQGRIRRDIGDTAFIFDPVADAVYQLDLAGQTAKRLSFSIEYERTPTAVPSREKGVVYVIATPQGNGFRFSATINLAPLGSNRLTSMTVSGNSIPDGSAGSSDQAIKDQVVKQLMMSQEHMSLGMRERPEMSQLGTKTFDGIVATGTRSVMTYAAGSIGNDQAFQIVHETWRSAELDREVLSTTTDPRNGDRSMRLINISKGDPDISIFKPPPGFTMQ
jgi:hypothetical protein